MNDKKIVNSIKWSGLTELFAKLISPISNMILARLLAPEAFGLVAIVNMFITGIDIVTDAGFGKYIVQHEFKNEEEKYMSENVAFWTNFFVSLFFGLLLFITAPLLANFFKNQELKAAFRVIAIPLLLTSFSSVQQNILRRNFEYKKLFYVRIVLTLIPLFVTLPLAYFTKSFWALIIGQVAIAAANTLMLMFLGSWRPKLIYSFDVLKEMFSFSFWSSMEAIGHWFIFWVDTIFVSYYFNEFQLGLYKNSQNMIFSIFSIVSATMSSVLLSILSRIKDDKEYEKVFLNIQKLFTYILVPMCIGLIFFAEPVTSILLGSRWKGAERVFALGGFMMFFNVLFYSFPAEIFKSKGQPKQLFIVQLQFVLVLLPILYITANMEFWTLVYARSISVLIITALSLYRLKNVIGFNIGNMIRNFKLPVMSGLVLVAIGILYKVMFTNIQLSFIKSIIIILIVGLVHVVYLFICFKNDITETVKILNKKN